ncbi:hypothetical protein MRX96_006957 [Rhipicephalus microplus]
MRGNGVAGPKEAMVKYGRRIAADGQTWCGKHPWGAADKFPPFVPLAARALLSGSFTVHLGARRSAIRRPPSILTSLSSLASLGRNMAATPAFLHTESCAAQL